MKTINRLCKAAVVIVIVGIGLVHNLNKTSIFSKSLNTVSVQLENDILANDTLKVNENRFLNYSKSVIKSSIQQLISNL